MVTGLLIGLLVSLLLVLLADLTAPHVPLHLPRCTLFVAIITTFGALLGRLIA